MKKKPLILGSILLLVGLLLGGYSVVTGDTRVALLFVFPVFFLGIYGILALILLFSGLVCIFYSMMTNGLKNAKGMNDAEGYVVIFPIPFAFKVKNPLWLLIPAFIAVCFLALLFLSLWWST